jgi:hypothetical protein
MPDALLQAVMGWIQHTTEELEAFAAFMNHVIAAVQVEEELMLEKFFHQFTALCRFASRIGEDDKVIAVAQVFFDTQIVFYVPIECVHVNVRKYLTRHIADSDSA